MPGNGHVRIRVHALREAEIGDAGLIGGVDENVGWLEIAMQDAALVRALDCIRHRREETRRAIRGQQLPSDKQVVMHCKSGVRSAKRDGLRRMLSAMTRRSDAARA